MKKRLLLLGFVLFSFTMQSQVLISLLLGDKLNSDGLEFGLEGGVNYSSISGMNSNDKISAFNIGFYFDIRLKDQWYLDTGVLVKSKQGLDKLSNKDLLFLGVEIHPEEGNYEQVVKNFLVPVQLKYKFNNYWYIEGGIQFGLVTKAYVEFNSDESGQEIRIREKNRDMINRFDVCNRRIWVSINERERDDYWSKILLRFY